MSQSYFFRVYREVLPQLGVRRKSQETKYVIEFRNEHKRKNKVVTYSNLEGLAKNISDRILNISTSGAMNPFIQLSYFAPTDRPGNIRDLLNEEIMFIENYFTNYSKSTH